MTASPFAEVDQSRKDRSRSVTECPPWLPRSRPPVNTRQRFKRRTGSYSDAAVVGSLHETPAVQEANMATAIQPETGDLIEQAQRIVNQALDALVITAARDA